MPRMAPGFRIRMLRTGGRWLFAGPGMINSRRLVRDSPQMGQRARGRGSRIHCGTGPLLGSGEALRMVELIGFLFVP